MPLPLYQPRQPVPNPANPQADGIPPLIYELDAQQWAQWKRHPITALVFEHYLPAFRAALERQVLEGWLVNAVPAAQLDVFKGHLLGAHQMEALSLPQLREFYGLNDAAAAAPSNGLGGRR